MEFVCIAAMMSAASAVGTADDSSHAAASSFSGKRADMVTDSSFVRILELKHVLRVCNAYPYEVGLDVYNGRNKLTESPLEYKTCGQFTPTIKAGDKLDFKVEDSSAGTFTLSELPQNDATLLMVIYRHDTLSNAVAFESHVYSNVEATQIAVIDTYKGKAKSEIRIADMKPQRAT